MNIKDTLSRLDSLQVNLEKSLAELQENPVYQQYQAELKEFEKIKSALYEHCKESRLKTSKFVSNKFLLSKCAKTTLDLERLKQVVDLDQYTLHSEYWRLTKSKG